MISFPVERGSPRPVETMDALVLVHLSSLDAYAELEGDAAAGRLAERMLEGAETHDGPVFVVDQGWAYRGRRSEARRALARALRLLMLEKDVLWVRWNETDVDWPRFLLELADLLADKGVTSVRLGGVWYDPGGELGCTTEAAQFLSSRFEVRVDDRLVACVPGVSR